MTPGTIIFYILALLILGFGLASILTRKILHAALYLFFALLCVAGLYFFMNLEFLAGVQIAVYVGGVVVFIIFSIFLTHQTDDPVDAVPLKRLATATGAAAAAVGILLFFLWKFPFQIANEAIDANMQRIGTLLLDTDTAGYALPFEIISIILLAALIGSILIAKSETPGKPEKTKAKP